jgi:Cu2+-exporting ATPase
VDGLPQADRWNAYTRPEVVEQVSRPAPGGLRSLTVVLEGLRCSACVWLADRTLRARDGLRGLEINAATGRARLTWDPAEVGLAELLRALDRVGLRPHPIAGEAAVEVALLERRTALKRLAVAGIGMMQVMMFAWPLYQQDAGLSDSLREYFRLASLLVTIPVALYSGMPFFVGAWHALRARTVSMDVPVAFGIGLAFVASVWNTLRGRGEVYFDSVTMFVFFLSLGRYVEMVARHRAGSVADALAQLAPATARRVRGAAIEDVPTLELAVGDELLVRRGEVFAADGVLLSGSARVDESMLTGESTAVAKRAGATLHTGTRNLGEPLRMQVTAAGDRTVLSGIVALLDRAQAQRPRLARAADRTAAWFLSRILVGAAFVFAAWWVVDPARAFDAALAVLVVTCPCALSLAAPAALAAATTTLARRGVLVASADALEALARADQVLWDKTGTLTHGLLRIEATQLGPRLDGAQALALAAAVERASEHPIARAFVAEGVAGETALEVRVEPGAGIEGEVGGRRVRVGTREFASALGDAGPGRAAASFAEGSWVHLGDAGGWLAAFRIDDRVRGEAAPAIAALRGLGLDSELASGDAASSVAAVAESAGIAAWSGRLRPEAKLERLAKLQAAGKVVLAVGDGINDAPLLGRADVSVAMGRGSALAQSGADLVLVREDLGELPRTVALARRTRRIVRQNLAWSVAYNLAALPLAAFGLIPPWQAAIGMSLSSIIVVANSLRLSRGAPSRRPRTALPRNAPAEA